MDEPLNLDQLIAALERIRSEIGGTGNVVMVTVDDYDNELRRMIEAAEWRRINGDLVVELRDR